MDLDAPAYLWLLVVVPAFVCASFFSIRRVKAWHETFTGVPKKSARLVFQTLLVCLVLVLVSVALAGPKMQYTRTVFNRSGIDLVIGVDVSKSMLAEDATLPAEAEEVFHVANRLNRARQFALDLLAHLRGERVGVFLFASQGIEVVPFTRDYGFSRYVLTYINDAEITVPGSDLGEAILRGISMFEEDGGRSARCLVLLSDGEDTRPEPGFLSETALLAAKKGIKVFPVGIGTGKSVLIPVRNEDGTKIVDYYIDGEGNPLKTRLEQGRLETVANATGGRYVVVSAKDAPGVVMNAILKEAREMEYTKATERAWLRLSPFLLLAGFILFGWGMWVGR
jgi:Ca-activated chloride channel family protein